MNAGVDAIQLLYAGLARASGMFAWAARALPRQACLLRAGLWRSCFWSRAAKKWLLLDLFQTIRAQSSIPSIRCVMRQGQELSYRQGKFAKVLCLNAPVTAS